LARDSSIDRNGAFKFLAPERFLAIVTSRASAI